MGRMTQIIFAIPVMLFLACQVGPSSTYVASDEQPEQLGEADVDSPIDQPQTDDCPLDRCTMTDAQLNERDAELAAEYNVPPGVVGVPEDFAALYPDEQTAEAHDGDGYCLAFDVEVGYYYYPCRDELPGSVIVPVPQPGDSAPIDDGRGIPPGTCWPDCFTREQPLIIPNPDGTPSGPTQGIDPELPTDVCGDGIVDAGEVCDDGNNTNGDGCDRECQREIPITPQPGGSEGTDPPGEPDSPDDTDPPETDDPCDNSLANSLELDVVYRDFRARNVADGHPDFEAQICGHREGAVQDTLDADGKPVLADAAPATCFNSSEAFSQWYRDIPDVNMTFHEKLVLSRESASDNLFTFESSYFFPLTGRGYGNTNNRNYHFTTELEADFRFSGNEILQFTGDDDVWVFINGKLALDIGGIHGAVSRTLRLTANPDSNGDRYNATYDIHVGDIVPIKIFHAERHLTQSNFKLQLTGYDLCIE